MPFEKDPSELGVGWEKTSSRGMYISGMLGDQPFVMFRNDKKAPGSKAPDWTIKKARPKDMGSREPAKDFDAF